MFQTPQDSIFAQVQLTVGHALAAMVATRSGRTTSPSGGRPRCTLQLCGAARSTGINGQRFCYEDVANLLLQQYTYTVVLSESTYNPWGRRRE